MSRALEWIDRNKLFLLFVALICSQLMTWYAVLGVKEEVEYTQTVIRSEACGGSTRYDRPCRVVIVAR